MKSYFMRILFYNFIKKETLAQVFSCEICVISKNTFFTEHLWAIASGSIRGVWTSPKDTSAMDLKWTFF